LQVRTKIGGKSMKDSNTQYRDAIIQRIMTESNVKDRRLVEKAFDDAHVPPDQWQSIAGGTALPNSLVKTLSALKQRGSSNT
jgi:hypothetical protein